MQHDKLPESSGRSGWVALFPGQGAQSVGMAKDLLEQSAAARALFDRATKVAGFDVAKLCREGPAETLDRTDICQVAILVHSLAAVEAFLERGGKRHELVAAAGLSLGEYSALCFAGALDFEEAVELTAARGRIMQDACDAEPSTMATVIGLDAEAVKQAVEKASGAGVLSIANYLAPGQVAISGSRPAVEKASEEARALGARRVVPLRVAGAFHSPLMGPAVARLRGQLKNARFQKPRIPVVSNVTACTVNDPEKIRHLLGEQIAEPVLWEQSLRAFWADGYSRFAEFGPGQVLTGLVRRTLPGAATRNLDNPSLFAPLEATS